MYSGVTAITICKDAWLVFCVVWLLAAIRTKPTQQRAKSWYRFAYGILVAAAFYLVLGDLMPAKWLRWRIAPHSPVVSAVGVTLTFLGMAFAIWARFYLGQNWSSAVSVKIGHELVRTGPYAWVRHPIYSGLLVAVIGTVLVRGQVRGIPALLLLWTGFWMKRRVEDQFMRKTFGAEYERYMRTTGSVVPRLCSTQNDAAAAR